MDRLTADGTVRLVNDKPVRFRHGAPDLVSLADRT
jgi:hypothetical protein